MVGPAPDPGSHQGGSRSPLVSLTLPELGRPVRFPEVEQMSGNTSLELGQLDRNTIVKHDMFGRAIMMVIGCKPEEGEELLNGEY